MYEQFGALWNYLCMIHFVLCNTTNVGTVRSYVKIHMCEQIGAVQNYTCVIY